MCPPVGARVPCLCVWARAHEVEKAVASRRGGMLCYRWSGWWCGGGGVGGSRGYVNGAAVNPAQGFEWR